MAELTLEEFLRRVAETAYLPDWANDGAAELLASGAQVTKETGGVKWCPFSRNLINDGRSLVPATESGFNRVVNPIAGGGMNINSKVSPCIKDACQVWNGVSCGMMAPVGSTALVQTMLGEWTRVIQERMAAEAEAASDGTPDTADGTDAGTAS